MPLPLNLCDDHHQAIAFLGDCPICGKFESTAFKRQFTSWMNQTVHQAQLESVLRVAYGPDPS